MATEPKALLDDCLELEGLIALIIQRDNQVPDHLYDLLGRKIESIRSGVESLHGNRDHISPMSTNVLSDENAEVSASVIFEEQSDADESPKSQMSEDNSQSGPIRQEMSTESDGCRDSVYKPAACAPEVIKLDIDKEDDEAPTSPDDLSSLTINYEEQEQEATVEPVNISTNKEGVVINDILQPATFSLNDRFRFRRELFDYSDEDMDDAIKVASAMSSVEEVEDYFYNDLCWNESDPNVIDFMRIITARFNK